jgi:hypothetical protein
MRAVNGCGKSAGKARRFEPVCAAYYVQHTRGLVGRGFTDGVHQNALIGIFIPSGRLSYWGYDLLSIRRVSNRLLMRLTRAGAVVGRCITLAIDAYSYAAASVIFRL